MWEGGCLTAQFGNHFPYIDPPWTVLINTWKGRQNQDKHNEVFSTSIAILPLHLIKIRGYRNLY